MAQKQDIFALVGKRMCASPRHRDLDVNVDYDMPPIADLIQRIDKALLERRAAWTASRPRPPC
ncbi:hypothetical protein HMP09_0399 [Sphingomonas sp. HMP9]|nr:hypothetical protein HMP09_0399 [Sphingomonas sp. HMP9]